MNKSNKNVTKLLTSVIITLILLLAGSCQNWMSNDGFMSKIEDEVHDANAKELTVFVRYAHDKMGKTEPTGNTKMKVDVSSKLSAVTADDYGFKKWAAFSTADFPKDKNHSDLMYISEESYNENFKDKELPADKVVFSAPTEPVTEVKILESRNDIFIIPIVAPRPAYVQSVPAGGDYNVVKNTSIRILFSKAIKKSTIYDEEGKLNYSISSSAATLVDDDQEIVANDITDYFDWKLSDSGKMLTLSLKKDAKTNEIIHYLDNRQRITITLFEGLCDTDGFAMNGNYTFSFQTGTSTDSLAPMIEVIFGGSGDKCNVFVSYHNVDQNGDATINGVATDAAKKAPTNIDSAEYTDALVAQRIYDKLNLFVKATDIIASGNADINPAKDLNEDNVNAIGIAASLWVDKDGKPVTLDETNTITKKNYVYIPGTIDKDSQMQGVFSEIVPLDKDGNKYTGGTIYTYDVSSLPDGLIKIDVWGIDMTGNSGGPADAGSPYYTKHDNGYKSIFVVKDTTAPDSANEAKKIKSNSEQAPYFWYNNTTLTSMQLYDLDANQIADAGHAKLRSLAKNLQWNFVVGKVEQAPAANDEHWKYIHDSDSGVSLKYELKDAKAPSADGPVDITMFIRDDIGNVSKPVLLNSIMYDNTQPTVKLKAGKGDFVKADGQDDLHVSEPIVITQILKVEIGEANENNAGSGIRRMEIHVKNKENGQEVAVPLDATKFAVKYAPASITNPTPSSEGIRDITPAADDTATTANLKVFKVTDADKITSGTLFIYGITLGNADGQYEVYVDLYDSALNKTPATAKTVMSRDTTDPIITKVQVMDAKARKVYGANEETWWLPYDRFEDANNLSKVTLVVTANESGSGLENLKLAENAEFTANTEIYINNTKLTKGVDYTLDVANRTIKLTDWYTPKLINANGGSQTIKIENVKLNNINVPAGAAQGQGNKIKLTVDDFVGKSKSENTITYDNTSVTGTLVYGDSVAPTIATLTVEDSAKNTTTNPESKAYNKDNFTDSQTVVLYLTLGDTEAGNKGSGVDKVILSDNAVFTGTTEIFVVNGSTETKLTPSTDYEIASDNKSVSFKKVFTETNKLKFTNVNIISATNGAQIIKADVQDFAGIKSVTSKPTDNTLVYDNVKPAVSLIKWVADDSTITAGSAKDKTISNQNLKVDFDEITAGVKVIKMDIVQEGISSTPYASPFGDTNFQLLDATGTPLAKGTDYTIDGQYIILTNPRLTGTLNFRGVTLNNATGDSLQGLYSINVALLDAAENRIDTNDPKYNNSQNHDPSIVIDNVAPVISKKLEIKNLHETTELTTGTSAWDGKWLDKSYIGGNGTGKAPDAIPVYITLKEKSSGVKVIKFAGSAVLSADTTTLFTVDANGTPTAITPRDERYEVHPESKEIIIKSKTDAKNTFSKSDGSEFTILVDNVGFANADSATAASNNTISVTISDVAKNVSASETTVEGRILSDSIAPAAPQNLKLKDRRSSAATKTIGASEGYTNEDIVDMTFNLTDSEQFGSGYHKFVLSGATFIGGDSADKTTMTVKVGDTAISDAEFALSDDGKTLTLKKTGQASNVYAVIRQAVSVELKNVKLDNGTTDGSKPVTLTAYDLTGWSSIAASTSITLDTHVPELEKGVFTAAYTPSSAAYYQPSINVYPHVNGESATGVPIDYGTETYQKDIPTFYTATTYKTGYYQYNGQVSSSSSSVNTSFDHGAVLGIRGKDNIRLGGWTRAKTFLYYYKYSNSDTLFSKTEEDILGSSNPTEDINSNRSPGGTGNSATGTTLWFGFDEGKYSAVIVDEAGNVSAPFHFAIVRDVEKPAKEWGSGSNADSLNNRVLLQKPDASANIFTNSAVSAANYTDFPRFYAVNGSSYDIRTKKYVTKKSGDKYKIQLNLGGTVSEPTLSSKINGGAAGNVAAYSDLTATTTHSPIEMYAVSTLYGSWPTSSTSAYTYYPVVPLETTFPSGQTVTSSNYSNYVQRDYFNYGNTLGSNGWYIFNSSKNNWHSYIKGASASDTYSYPNQSCSISITSYVDTNNNLIIEIPNTQSTVPISVFLKDGCGNMQYVVCGLYQENGYDVAISFVVDDKLGSAPTSNGVVTTPFIIQFPYSTYDTASDIQWGSYNFHIGTQSANSEDDNQSGTGATRGFIKDYVKHATYYNPALSSSTEALQFKHGFALHFFPNGVDREVASNITGKEDITFDDTDWSDTEKAKGIRKANATDIANGNYTCRALMYCTNSTAVPTYAQIKACYDAEKEKTPANKTGQVTEWSYVQVSSSAIEAILFVDYPKPNYTKLNWTVNNDEPVPHYMWYIFEDAVGNYELGKVVNSIVSGNSLKTAPSANGTDFDKWLYDNEAPSIVVNGSTTSPTSLTTSATNVSNFVPENNSSVAYLKPNTNTVYVYGGNRGSRGSSVNTTIGDGTIHICNHDGDSQYWPFFNLKVSKEITGIRAFAWSTSTTTPSFSSYASTDSDWVQYSTTYWMSGNSSLTSDIGGTVSYYGRAANAYYYSSSNYGSSKYSGTKINTVIPYGKLATDSATTLYLHVMDWTGNVTYYKMGSNMSFIKDGTAPSVHYKEDAYKNDVRSSDNEYYVRSDGSNIEVRIAGQGAGSSANKQDICVRLPDSYVTDGISGYKGFSFTPNDSSTALSDTTGPYLLLKYDTYKDFGTGTNKTVYFYDNVGLFNQSGDSVKFVYDTTAPKINSVSVVTKSGSGTTMATKTSLISNTETDYGIVYNCNAATTTWHDNTNISDGELNVIYLNKTQYTKFHVNMDPDTLDDLAEIKVNRWDGSKWVTKFSTKSSTWPVTDTFQTGSTTYCMGSSAAYGYNVIFTTDDESNTEGTYYQIVASDFSGNASSQYFKFILDNEAPVLTKDANGQTIKPAITLGKGSINKVTASGTNTWYYTADANNKLKLSFAINDTGVGSQAALKSFRYSLNGEAWTAVTNPTTIEFEVEEIASTSGYTNGGQIKTGYIETLYLEDILGNRTTTSLATPGFTYTYKDSGNVSHTESISNLTKYTEDAPAAPTINSGKLKISGKDYKIVEQVETYGKGYSDTSLSQISAEPIWTHMYTELLTGETKTVLIKGDETEARSKLRITFPAITDSSTTIGYIRTTTSTKPTSNKDSYSFRRDLGNVIEDNLPLAGEEDFSPVHLYYWAVDVVGNISDTPLDVIYSYNNPYKAQHIELIEDPLHSDKIPVNVKTQMQNDSYSLFKTVGDKPKNKKDGMIWFGSNYLVVKCATYEKAGSEYNETPASITLYDGYFENPNSSKMKYDKRGESGTSADNFKIYTSSTEDKVGGTGDFKNYHYCYIAFKLTSFSNNDDFDGSNLHIRIKGKTTNSDYVRIIREDPNDPSNEAGKVYGWKRDNQAPTVNSYYTENSDGKLILKNHIIVDAENNNYTSSQQKAYDYVGSSDKKPTNLYTSGSKIHCTINVKIDGTNKTTCISDDITDWQQMKYKFVVTTDYDAKATARDTDWVIMPTATIGSNGYLYTLPDVTVPNSYIALFIMDNVGNMTGPLYLGKNGDTSSRYWLLDKNPTSVTIDAPSYVAGTSSYELNLDIDSGNAGAVIKSIDCKNAEIESVTFNGYTSQPELSGTTFQNNESWINNSGLKIKIKNVTQGWSQKTVKLTINGNDYDVFTVDPKPFTAADVTISDADANKVVTLSPTETGAPLGTYITSVKAKVGNSEIGAAMAAGDNGTIKVTLSNIPAKTWSEQKVTLYINPTTENPDGLTHKDVLTIDAVQTSDITISEAVWSDADNAYVATVTYSNNAPTSAITTVSVNKGSAAFAANDRTKILLTNLPAKIWSSQSIDVTISDGGETNKITKYAALTIEGLKAEDFTVTGDAIYSNGEYTIAMADGSDLPSIEDGDFSAGEGVSVAWASPKVTLTVTQGWTAQTLTLKLKGLELKTITVEAKTISAGDIGITIEDGSGNTLTAYPSGEGAVTPNYLKISISVPTGVSITSVTSGGTPLSDQSNGNYGLTGNPIASDVKITIVTSNGTVSDIRLFPEIDSGHNRFFGRLISGKGKQEVYTFGDSPKSAGALQSHVVELPKFIQKFWQNDETAADEVTSTVTKEAKKAEKKSSKKASKKAASQAAKSVQEIAQTAAVTELPVEALEEPVADDQLAMILPKTANTEEAEVVEPQASVSSGAVDVSVTEAEPAGHSNAALWIILAVFCAAIAGLVLCLKKKRA